MFAFDLARIKRNDAFLIVRFLARQRQQPIFESLMWMALVIIGNVFASDWFLETKENHDNETYFHEPVVVSETLVKTLANGASFPLENYQYLVVTSTIRPNTIRRPGNPIPPIRNNQPLRLPPSPPSSTIAQLPRATN